MKYIMKYIPSMKYTARLMLFKSTLSTKIPSFFFSRNNIKQEQSFADRKCPSKVLSYTEQFS